MGTRYGAQKINLVVTMILSINITTSMEIISDHVTWQRSSEPDALKCDIPRPIKDIVPEWFKDLRGSFSQYSSDPGYSRTARHCLGLRGAMDIGWTIPWRRGFIRGVPLHPEQLHGSMWSEKTSLGYQWHLHIMCYPWRARLPRGWRLYMCPHPLMWSPEWYAFSGAVDANYDVRHGTDIGSFWRYDYSIDDDWCYYNLEHVMAFRVLDGYDLVRTGTPLFSAIPIYDPGHQPRQSR